MTSASNSEAATSVRLFILESKYISIRLAAGYCPPFVSATKAGGSPPLNNRSTQFQSRQTQQRKQYCQDHKSKDNFRFFPPDHLKVVMQRRHLENAPPHAAGALRHLEHRNLQHHR